MIMGPSPSHIQLCGLVIFSCISSAWKYLNDCQQNPHPVSINNDYKKPTSRYYLDGTLLPLILQCFKSGTIQVRNKLEEITKHVRDAVLFFAGYYPGMLDGDGTWCGVVHNKNIISPVCKLALSKDVNQSPMKALMKCIFPPDAPVYPLHIKIVLASNSLWTKCLFFWGCNMGLSMKYDQFVELFMIAESMELIHPNIKSRKFTPHLVYSARKFIGHAQSALNYGHGAGLKKKQTMMRDLQT